MADNAENKIDAFTDKYTEGFEKFSNSKSGNIILDFILFKRNLLPYTLQIIFILGVIAAWIVAILGILKRGPIGLFFPNFIESVGVSAVVFVFAPFVVHYVLELLKVLCKSFWRFVLHVYEKVLTPAWNILVIRFLANVAPQIFPFLYERFMKAIDIGVCKLEPLLDAVSGMIVAMSVTLIAVLKGIVWLPKKVYQCLGRWLDKVNEGEVAEPEK